MGKYFGTDGVRGEANVELTPNKTDLPTCKGADLYG